jgi:HKD family nuclease
MSTLQIQDPDFASSYSLHEAILASCKGAVAAGGAFAFVTKKALELVLAEDTFQSLMREGHFFFIAGIDEITNVATLNHLDELSTSYSGFKVRAYAHENNGSLFHPKFCWFRNENGGFLVIGSGNFTVKGLRKNREAFSVICLDRQEMDDVEEKWNAWIESSASVLKCVDEESVLKRARLNRLFFKKNKKLENELPDEEAVTEPSTPFIKEADEVDQAEWTFGESSSVLIAEIPKSGNRWKQANFDKETFQNFFGATPGDNNQRILLRSVLAGGELGEIENRLSVSVKSQNYRFELAAADGLEYPASRCPIGVFVRLSLRMFLYVLLMPGENGYIETSEWLDENWNGRADRMKRITCNVSEVLGLIRFSRLSEYIE